MAPTERQFRDDLRCTVVSVILVHAAGAQTRSAGEYPFDEECTNCHGNSQRNTEEANSAVDS